MSKLDIRAVSETSDVMRQLEQRSPKQLVALFLDPALPMNLMRSSIHPIARLIELCKSEYVYVETVHEGLRDIVKNERIDRGNVKPFNLISSMEDGACDLLLATPLAIASYFIRGAFDSEAINGNPMIATEDVPNLLEEIVKMMMPDGQIPKEYKGINDRTVATELGYHLKLPRQFSILEDIEATHMLRLICISQQDANSKKTLFDEFKNSYSGPITNYAAKVIYPMIEEVQKRIQQQMKDEKSHRPGQQQAFDLARVGSGLNRLMRTIPIKNMPQA